MRELIFENVTKKYDNVVIDNLNYTFNLQNSVAFVGRNGCGKSTMLKMIAGLMKPTSGKIIYSDKVSIGYVPDKFTPVNMTAKEYIETMCLIDGMKKDNIQKAIKKWSDKFFVTDMLDKNMRVLSKGTLQKIGVIQAVIKHCDILILDEPLTGQDIESQRVFVDTINDLRERGTGIFLSSHEPELVNMITDEAYTIRGGQILKYNKKKADRYIVVYEKAEGRGSEIVSETQLQKRLMELLQNGMAVKGVYKNDTYDNL